MKFIVAFALGVASVATAQGVTELITPTGAPPAGCTGTFDGEFQIQPNLLPSKRDLESRETADLVERQETDNCGSGDGALRVTLKDGVMKDGLGRTAYIADNFQFQFDGPPQTGAIYTGGFSACPNNTVALGSSAVFYACLSGNFNNLYDRHWAAQCQPIQFTIGPCKSGSNSGSSSSAVVSSVVSSAVSSAASASSAVATPTTSAWGISETSGGQISIPTTVSIPPAVNVTSAAPTTFSTTGAANLSTSAAPTAVTSNPAATTTPATGAAPAVGATTGIAAMVFGVAALVMF